MTNTGETKTTHAIRNWIASGVTAVVLVAAAIGVTSVVNTSNQEHATQVAQAADAQTISGAASTTATDASKIVDTAVAADTQRKHDAAVKQQEADAAAAKAAQQAAAAKAAAAAQAVQATSDDNAGGDSGSGPVKCPAGTTANAVDAAGNESNCQSNNASTGQPCVAYDANNNCTAWLEQ